MNLPETPICDANGELPAGLESVGTASPCLIPLPGSKSLQHLIGQAAERGLIASETLYALLAALLQRDAATAEHSYRTACWSAWLAKLAQLGERDSAILAVAALLHDIGKIGITDEILLKPSELTPAETQRMQQFRPNGAKILAACRAGAEIVTLLAGSQAAADATGAYDSDYGTGSWTSHALAVADAFDAMTSRQPYRNAMSHSEALEQLRRNSGERFNPDVIALFAFGLDSLPEGAGAVQGSIRDLAQCVATVPNALNQMGVGGIVEALNLVSDAVCMVDRDLQIRVWNERAEKLTGYTSADMLGKKWNETLIDYFGEVSLPREQRRTLMSRCLEQGTPLTERAYLWNIQGDCIPVESRAVPMRDANGQVLGAIEIIRDLSTENSLQLENEQLRRVSQTDQLTQILNRPAFERILNEQVQLVGAEKARCSLILLDIDYFKSINDTFGHPVGDTVLKAFADLLVQCCRSSDVVARYGGEEFAILLPDCNWAAAYERAESIRAEFPSLRLPVLKGRAVTASMGVTEIHAGDTDSAVVGRADEALYRSKKHGRNRTEVAYGESIRQNGHEYTCSWTISGLIDVAMLKLNGFVNVCRAELVESDRHRMRLRIGRASMLRRVGLRHGKMPVEVTLSFSRTHISERTQVQVVIRANIERPAPAEFHQRCCEILATLRSHLMVN